MTLHLTGCWPAEQVQGERAEYDLRVARTILSRLGRAARVTHNERMRSVLFEWDNDEDAGFIADAFDAGQ